MGFKGTVLLDFGAFPGASDAAVFVSGQTGILTTSLVEAWVRLEATSDHSVDEHRVETLAVSAGGIVAGSGFWIYGRNTSERSSHGMGTRLYGTFTVSWVWD